MPENAPPSYYDTVTKSPEWRAWIEHCEGLEMPPFDISESMETGWLSPEHFSAFIRFVVRWYKSESLARKET